MSRQEGWATELRHHEVEAERLRGAVRALDAQVAKPGLDLPKAATISS